MEKKENAGGNQFDVRVSRYFHILRRLDEDSELSRRRIGGAFIRTKDKQAKVEERERELQDLAVQGRALAYAKIKAIRREEELWQQQIKLEESFAAWNEEQQVALDRARAVGYLMPAEWMRGKGELNALYAEHFRLLDEQVAELKTASIARSKQLDAVLGQIDQLLGEVEEDDDDVAPVDAEGSELDVEAEGDDYADEEYGRDDDEEDDKSAAGDINSAGEVEEGDEREEGGGERGIRAVESAKPVAVPTLDSGGGSASPGIVTASIMRPPGEPEDRCIFRDTGELGVPVPAKTRHEGAEGEEAGMVCPGGNTVLQAEAIKAPPGGVGVLVLATTAVVDTVADAGGGGDRTQVGSKAKMKTQQVPPWLTFMRRLQKHDYTFGQAGNGDPHIAIWMGCQVARRPPKVGFRKLVEVKHFPRGVCEGSYG